MTLQVTTGALMTCSFGAAPSALNVLPVNRHLSGPPPAATIMDHAPIVNIPPFGLCSSLANPTVASATAAALGVLTPMPCIPVTPAPWVPGSPTVMIGSALALNDTSKCTCTWGGIISLTTAGQFTESIP